MPNPSSASASSSADRSEAAQALYVQRGIAEASSRCDANSRFGTRDLTEEILKQARPQAGETLVDVGCGSGQHLLRFQEAVAPHGKCLGFDLSPDAVSAARARGVRAEVADAAALPLPDNASDVLICTFAVYYLADLAQALHEWQRILRPDGRLVISGPAGDTNAELYAFHRRAAGREPSDVDQMALGYVEKVVFPALPVAGFVDARLETFVNPILFPDATHFLSYWQTTSLFIRTIPEPEREVVLQRGQAIVREQSGPFTVTKRVALAVARKPA